jgi:hypothetical protein
MVDTEATTLTSIPELESREKIVIQVPSPSTTDTETPHDPIPSTGHKGAKARKMKKWYIIMLCIYGL